MATRSSIGVILDDGTVKSVYCHWDGYPEYVGYILYTHYTDPTKIHTLLDHGGISSLKAEITDCTFYPPAEAEHHNDSVEQSIAFWFPVVDYQYLWNARENMWYYSCGDAPKPLATFFGEKENA